LDGWCWLRLLLRIGLWRGRRLLPANGPGGKNYRNCNGQQVFAHVINVRNPS